MEDNNSDKREFELGKSPLTEFDFNDSIKEIMKTNEDQDYRRSLRGELEREYGAKNEERSVKTEKVKGPDKLDMPETGRFDVTKGTAADVAYLAWKSDGPVTPIEIEMESMKPDSRTEVMTRDDAEQGLIALAHAGLVGFGGHEYTEDNQDLYMGDLEHGFTGGEKLMPDSSSLGPINYKTGGEEELRAPVTSEDDVISDPTRAFQEVGQMQQNYEFALDLYTETFNDF